MLALHDNRRYFLYQPPADMRKSFDGLGGLVKQQMKLNLLSGDIFIFLNKRRNQLKLLCWDSDGLCLYHKRLEKGTFELPAAKNGDALNLSAMQLRLILEGIQLGSIKRRPRFALST
jgi:transposase